MTKFIREPRFTRQSPGNRPQPPYTGAKGGWWRWLLLVALLVSVRPAQAQDPRALLQKTMDAYQKLNSYEGVASVDILYLYNGKPIPRTSNAQTVRLKMQRPNRLLLQVDNPSGSLLVISDGTNFYIYGSKLNQFIKTATQPTLGEAMLILLATRTGIQAEMDPLFFLAIHQLPKPFGAFQFKGSATYNGKPVFIVSSTLHTPERRGKLPDGRTYLVPAKTAHFTWWINKQTSLLEKIETVRPDMRLRVPVRQGKKVVARDIPVTQRLRHVVTSGAANPALSGDAFKFVPPPGATERRDVKELLKSGGK